MRRRSGFVTLCFAAGFVLCAEIVCAESAPNNQRQITVAEMARRPQDPWPRGDGHVLLGEPGGPLSQKAYHEPGGSFTPSPGSFGVSVWVKDAQDKLVATSDSIPLDKIAERYVFADGAKLPALEDTTPYYSSTLIYESAGRWRLDVKGTSAEHKLELVIRSVGPAGGPLSSVVRDSARLLLNRRWVATPSETPAALFLGDESAGELQTGVPQRDSVASETGWAFARLGFGQQSFSLQLADTKPQFGSALACEKAAPQFAFELPDKRFEESLKAQVATLLMGYIGRQTGPGEPINYPLAWERDGAYSLMAMAKCGQRETARDLAAYFAENDFFGGFGAEGDAAGSATNALIEVGFLLDDPQYFQWLWPHVVRKMAIVDEMLGATADIYKEYVGPLAPHLLKDPRRHQQICKPASDGLIVGSMDLHFPILYISAISYRGLIQASRLAAVLGKADVAAAWKAKAEKLRAAWVAVFGQKKYDNERNFMVSVWPSWILNKDCKPFAEALEANRAKEQWAAGQPKRRPLWTYFSVSQAHQWLFLERPERTWEILEYFFAHQCAPGLYTYWEGSGEENSFKQWENYRGWLKPKYVTPHYWTASEMLHLQLDMLVYVNESKDDFEIVIGGGVPGAWLKEPMRVKNYRTKAGVVSWDYNAGQLTVKIAGAKKKYAVRPGVNFRENGVKLDVGYE